MLKKENILKTVIFRITDILLIYFIRKIYISNENK